MSFRVATPILLFFAAIGVRILSWHSVFQQGGVYANGNDAYYHFRRIRYSIDHFPSVLDFDPLINFPAGAQPIWPPTFDWLIAAGLRLLPNIDRAEQLERFAVWIPPIVGAATVLIVYFIGLRFFSRAVATLAAMSMLILPAHSVYSRLGALDHHFLVATLMAIMLMLAMELFRDQSAFGGGGAKLIQSVALGLSIGAAVLVWPGTLFHIGVLQLAMVIRLVSADDSAMAQDWALRFAVVQGVACLAVYPMSAGNEWELWGAFSPVVLSNFQPLYFFVAAACFGSVGVSWRAGIGSATRLTRTLSAGVLGSMLLIGLFLTIPELSAAIHDALSWFAKEEEFQSVVSESVPLFAGPSGWKRALAFLGGFVYIAPLAAVYFGWRHRARAEVLLLIGWGMALFFATLVQWRFMNSYSIAHCLLIGITLESAYRGLQTRLIEPRRTGAVAVMTALVIAAYVHPVMSYGLHFGNVERSLRGESVTPLGALLRTRRVVDAARFLRDNSPPPERDPYSVLGPWGDGHILKYVAGRAVVQDNFGDDVAPENFARAERYFAAKLESEALDLVTPVAARYVLVRSTGSGHSQGYAATSMFSRLYRLKGSRGQPSGRWGRNSPVVASLGRHRLIYQSAPLREGGSMPYCMLFEIVEGAKLVGRADPGTVVRVSLAIEPRTGRGFTYSARVVSDSDGKFAIRLPYSNESFSPDVRSGAQYTVRIGTESVAVIVSESDVLDGSEVVVPLFESG